MSTPIRTFLLTGLLFLGLATGAQAQDKYEFASVTQWGFTKLVISIEGKPLEFLPFEKTVKHPADHAKLFDYLGKMQDEGWEVYNVLTPTFNTLQFILRRKKA